MSLDQAFLSLLTTLARRFRTHKLEFIYLPLAHTILALGLQSPCNQFSCLFQLPTAVHLKISSVHTDLALERLLFSEKLTSQPSCIEVLLAKI